MKTDTIKTTAESAEGTLFLGYDWFDPLEAGVQTRIRGFNLRNSWKRNSTLHVQSGNLNLEIWSSDGCRPKNGATIETAFVLMPTGTGESEESFLACASGRRPSAR